MFLLFNKDYAEAGDIGTTNTASTEESLQNDNQANIGKIGDELKFSKHTKSQIWEIPSQIQ